jgi:hypothetical protein
MTWDGDAFERTCLEGLPVISVVGESALRARGDMDHAGGDLPLRSDVCVENPFGNRIELTGRSGPA